jgi:hypothetical protein
MKDILIPKRYRVVSVPSGGVEIVVTCSTLKEITPEVLKEIEAGQDDIKGLKRLLDMCQN